MILCFVTKFTSKNPKNSPWSYLYYFASVFSNSALCRPTTKPQCIILPPTPTLTAGTCIRFGVRRRPMILPWPDTHVFNPRGSALCFPLRFRFRSRDFFSTHARKTIPGFWLIEFGEIRGRGVITYVFPATVIPGKIIPCSFFWKILYLSSRLNNRNAHMLEYM